jgi:hypothetical protein
MKKVSFIILGLFAACHSNYQPKTEKTEIMFPFGDPTFNWKGIEKQDDNLKAVFNKQLPTLLKDEYSIYTYEKKDILKDCHLVDINNDGVNDIIYNGSSGGEGSEVTIFFKTKDGFKNIFKQIQHIKKLEFKENKLYRLFIYDDGCCADYNDFNKIYQTDYSGNIPRFNLIYLTANTHRAYFPKKYFDKPIYFEVLNNNYKMRENPKIDDTSKNGMGGIEFIGNNIDTLNKGTKGRAIANETDKTGRVWWLVEIDSAYNSYGDLFYHSQFETKYTASRMGWISSRYVKKINK